MSTAACPKCVHAMRQQNGQLRCPWLLLPSSTCSRYIDVEEAYRRLVDDSDPYDFNDLFH